MNKSEAINFVNILKQTYPDAQCSLDFNNPFQLAIAVMLSAQCTDERVNKTTHTLFERCKTIEDFENIDINELENIIHPCGFYKNKAKNINLIKIFPKETLKDINHLFMWLGRNTCEARNPHCDSCSVKQYCNFYKKMIKVTHN